MVENTVGKGEIACYKQFLLFPLCFKMLILLTCKKKGLVWERINSSPNNKMLKLSILKAFADNEINVTQRFNFDLGRVKPLW